MSEQIACPCCGWIWRKPLGLSMVTTTWTDDCACSDHGACVHHQAHPELTPDRPSDEVLRARAQRRYERNVREWEQKRDTLVAACPPPPSSGATE